MVTPPRTIIALRHLAQRLAALAAEAETLADTVDRARAPLDPAQEVTRAVDLHRALANALDRDLAGDLGFDQTLSRGLDRARSRSHELDRRLGRAAVRARWVKRVLELDDELDKKLGGVGDDLDEVPRGRDLLRVVVRVVGFFLHWAGLQARFLFQGVALSLTLEDAHAAAWGIRDAVSTMEARVWDLLVEAQGSVAGAQTPAVSRLAQRMLELALGVLPVKQRPRYREEFLGDLHALAQSQASQRAQLGHAFMVAIRMWSVQRALRAAPPTEERVR